MTTAPALQPPHHDNMTCYRFYDCRLPACVERVRNYWRNREQAVTDGTWQPYIDAAPVRRHLLALNAAGITDTRIAQVTGLPLRTITGYTKPRSDRGRKRGTRPEVADKILAITVDNTRPSYIDPTGAGRRIGALVAKGWPMRQLAAHLGVRPSFIWDIFRRTTIRVTTAEAIENLYDELVDKRPSRCGVDKASAKRARAHAARNRWAPPSYWVDRMDVIDDHDFTPEYGISRTEIVAEEATWLLDAGFSIDAIAKRLDVTRGYVEDAIRKTNKRTYQEAA